MFNSFNDGILKIYRNQYMKGGQNNDEAVGSISLYPWNNILSLLGYV